MPSSCQRGCGAIGELLDRDQISRQPFARERDDLHSPDSSGDPAATSEPRRTGGAKDQLNFSHAGLGSPDQLPRRRRAPRGCSRDCEGRLSNHLCELQLRELHVHGHERRPFDVHDARAWQLPGRHLDVRPVRVRRRRGDQHPELRRLRPVQHDRPRRDPDDDARGRGRLVGARLGHAPGRWHLHAGGRE